MTPQFYNSLTKQIEPLRPKHEGKVRIYNCGPTVYKRQHLGNMRRFLFSDFLRRSLELLGYEVRDITNITDVGHLTEDDLDQGADKLEEAAKTQKVTPQEIAVRQTKLFFEDLKALNIQPAHAYPRATDHIKQMQDLIAKLIERGHAYPTASGIYFEVRSFPDYGKLSGNKLEDIAAGKRVAVRQEKRHPADFGLWINDKGHLQKWDSPWGIGYPGWHIECSAMSLHYLDSEIDIHTGGEDNLFPHHENEIAQSEGATGQLFVRMWLHNRHLNMAGRKMAKREGEQVTIETLTKKNISPLAFRLLVFGSHYRQTLDFSWESLNAAAQNLGGIRQTLRLLAGASQDNASPNPEVLDDFKSALADDLNTPEALAVFARYITDCNRSLSDGAAPAQQAQMLATILTMDRVLGVAASLLQEILSESIPQNIITMTKQREEARKNHDFKQADTLREEIEKQGFTVEDTSAGPRIVKKHP